MSGSGGNSVAGGPAPRRRELSVDDYVKGVLDRDRMILGRAITLVESNAPRHGKVAQEMLKKLLPHTEKSVRVGISGVPGAGKSTLIEALGSMLCDLGHRVAVLAVDPTSSVTRGSILGDKTRMQQLARNQNAFIRPSPSGGVLGGVARKTRETMLVCEAAGFDVILVETVGVGQSEVAVRNLVDFFLLVLIAGAGDELQGLKRGIMEICDLIAVNKADGDNKVRAQTAAAEFNRILHYLSPATRGWETRAMAVSARTGECLDDLWRTVGEFVETTKKSGVFVARRREQAKGWVHAMVEEYLKNWFFRHPRIVESLPGIEQAVENGELAPALAVSRLVDLFENKDCDAETTGS